MERFVLTDAQWAKIELHCLGKPTDPGRSGSDNRLFIEAVLWITRTGSPWRDLPAHFGNWSTAFRRFSDWRRVDVFVKLFEACSDEPDMKYAMVDATIAMARAQKGDSEPGHRPLEGWHDHQDVGADRCAWQSRALRTAARPALRHRRGRPPLEDIEFGGLIADKAFDSDAIVADLNKRGAKVVISQHPRRARPLPLDRELYKWRHLIENFFCKLKEFKRIAMRADKTDQSFSAMIYLAAAIINSR